MGVENLYLCLRIVYKIIMPVVPGDYQESIMSVDRFVECIKTLEAVPTNLNLWRYSSYLIDAANYYYPDALPRLVDGRITCLVREQEKRYANRRRNTQLSLF